MTVTNVNLCAYLNINNPMVAWEVAIGRVRSACDTTAEKFGVSIWAYNTFRRLAGGDRDPKLRNELLLEQVRARTRSDAVSRLEGLYFFESEEDARVALDRWGISGRKQFISEVSFSANRLTRLDSEWITQYLRSADVEWMPSYWEGATLGERPLTEVLASGIGWVRNRDLRREAYQLIATQWPTATPLLAMACCAFAEEGLEDIALMRPAIVSNEGAIVGSHVIDIRNLKLHEKEVARAIDSCKRRGEFPSVTIPEDGNSFFSIPDMRHMDFAISDAESAAILASIHEASLGD